MLCSVLMLASHSSVISFILSSTRFFWAEMMYTCVSTVLILLLLCLAMFASIIEKSLSMPMLTPTQGTLRPFGSNIPTSPPHHPTHPHSSTCPCPSTRPSTSPSSPSTCPCTCCTPPPSSPVSHPTCWPSAVLPSSLHFVPSFDFPTLPSSSCCSLASCPSDFDDCPSSSQCRFRQVAKEHQPAGQSACG